ncbi:MAG TPA: DUF1501 domain-containing protein [Kofleriaceae bacterium]|nr:DUF1501 domain-containing protein [Kofleriaceae bacterium]
MTMHRRDFLAGALAGAAFLALPKKRTRAAAMTTPKNLMIILSAGGWDTTYALDPKPGLKTVDAPAGQVKSFGNLDILVDPSRPAINAFFEKYAPLTAVVRGISVRSVSHSECRKRMLTGTPSASSPDLGAICAHDLGRELPLPYLILGDEAFTGPLAASAGRVGLTNQITALLDPAKAYERPANAAYPASAFVPDGADEKAIRAFVTARAERERAQRGQLGENRARIDDFESSLGRGDKLKPFAKSFGSRGRNLALSAQGELASDVIGQGISRAAMLDSRISWDTHQNNADQGAFHNKLFSELGGILDGLAARKGAKTGNTLLDETVVVVMSEMSRTPKLNAAQGKGHWPVTSALIIGPGVKGGHAFGATTDRMEASPINFATGAPDKDGGTLQTDNLAAGVLELCGADVDRYFSGTERLRGFIA